VVVSSRRGSTTLSRSVQRARRVVRPPAPFRYQSSGCEKRRLNGLLAGSRAQTCRVSADPRQRSEGAGPLRGKPFKRRFSQRAFWTRRRGMRLRSRRSPRPGGRWQSQIDGSRTNASHGSIMLPEHRPRLRDGRELRRAAGHPRPRPLATSTRGSTLLSLSTPPLHPAHQGRCYHRGGREVEGRENVALNQPRDRAAENVNNEPGDNRAPHPPNESTSRLACVRSNSAR
jgi:hypothetical protein